MQFKICIETLKIKHKTKKLSIKSNNDSGSNVQLFDLSEENVEYIITAQLKSFIILYMSDEALFIKIHESSEGKNISMLLSKLTFLCYICLQIDSKSFNYSLP